LEKQAEPAKPIVPAKAEETKSALAVVGSASRETEVNKSYRNSASPALELINTLDNEDTIWACEDKSSTTKKPIMYVETVEGGVVNAFLVDVSRVNLSTMTDVEGYAMAKYVGDKFAAQENSPKTADAYTGLDAATQAKLLINNTDYLSAVNKKIASYQMGLDAASKNFADTLLGTIGKSGNSSVLDKFFL
jgi:hypothetical protein